MHWFWITCISSTICKPLSASQYSSSTVLPAVITSGDLQSTEVLRGSTSPPTTSVLPITIKNTTIPKNTSFSKLGKLLKKNDFIFQNTTMKNRTKEDKVKETVINVMENVTDNQLFINASFTAINRTDNLTYLEEEVNFNQSSIQNSERLGVEVEDDEVHSSGGNLSAAGITGITLGCVVTVGLLSGISYFVYRNRGFNRPQVLNDRCSNPDSSGYIDDASVRDNSEEMYSLDNDSFLNSLEAMTIQNYWTDTVKHTKL
ncbi:hypothetical protein JTB14_034518 [Gonioctena quinquepunctata]|nr:hypothetical protein JTB14_034518 [Gonioctena quinquepunctata]